MDHTSFFASKQVAFRFLVLLGVVCLISLPNLAAAEALPLPDTVQFADTAKLPVGVQEKTLHCSIVSENNDVLVVETSTVPGVNSRLSIDKLLIAEIKRGDPSDRPYAEIIPELALPSESMDTTFYDDRIDRVFRPFLKKFPQSPHAKDVQNAEKAYTEESQRAAGGEFRAGTRWTDKASLSPIDLTAIQLIQQACRSGPGMSQAEFNKLVEDSRKCFASEFFPILGPILEKVSADRVAKLKSTLDPEKKDPEKEKLIANEPLALEPIKGWDWPAMSKGVDMVWKAENQLKTSPPEQIAVSIDLILQSRDLMPFLLARERVLRQQSQAYAEKAIEAAKDGKRALSSTWWHASLMLAGQLPPPENDTLSQSLLRSLEKTYTEQARVMVEKRQYDDATSWFQEIIDFMSKIPSAANRMGDINKRFSDFQTLLKKQIDQQTIDNLRKQLAEDQSKNDFEDAKIILSVKWEEVQKLNPTPEEVTIFADAALDASGAAFKALKPIVGCQLIALAQNISPKNPRVKTWVFGASLSGLALFLVLLFPIFWIFASSGMFLENIRYRLRLKSLRKSSDKKSANLRSARKK